MSVQPSWRLEHSCANYAEAKIVIADQIVAFHNSEPLHSVLGNLPPSVNERGMAR